VIIITSSDPQFQLFARHILVREGLDTMLATDCEAALFLSRTEPAAGMLVDWGASHAIPLFKAIKLDAMTQHLTLVALLDLASAKEYPLFVNAGADAIFVRPIDPVHLLEIFTSTQSLKREPSLGHTISSNALVHDQIVLDPASRRCLRNGSEVDLTVLEFNVLHCLLRQPNRVMSRRELIAGAWPKGIFVDDRTVNVHIARLRRALMRYRGGDPIRTVRGIGYALRPWQLIS
jgi:two-component system phosphate regulon response regulator PhoB